MSERGSTSIVGDDASPTTSNETGPVRGRRALAPQASHAEIPANLRLKLRQVEARRPKQAGELARRLGVAEATARKYLRVGTDSIASLKEIAAALDTSPGALLEPVSQDRQLVSATLVAGGEAYTVWALIDAAPAQPNNLGTLCAWQTAGQWQAGPFHLSPNVPVYRVWDWKSRGTPMPLPHRQYLIAVVSDDGAFAHDIAAALSGYGFDTWVATTAAQALDMAMARQPGLMIFDHPAPPVVLASIRDRLKVSLPAIMLSPAPPQADPTSKYYYAHRDGSDLVYAVRGLVYFSSPHLAPRTR